MENQVNRTEVKRYNWSKQEETNLKSLVYLMYDKGMNIAEIKNDFLIMLNIAIYELEVEEGMK